LILILGALVQLAFVYERQIGIENAVRDAARRAATFETINPTEATANAQYTWALLVDPGGLLDTNVQGYSGSASTLQNPTVCYRTALDTANENSVLVKVSMGYSHPLTLPLITQILDGFDGVNDSALRIDTNSEFRVYNDGPASVDFCWP
jgi:hypothetical protein